MNGHDDNNGGSGGGFVRVAQGGDDWGGANLDEGVEEGGHEAAPDQEDDGLGDEEHALDPPAVVARAGDEVVANGRRAGAHLTVRQQHRQRCKKGHTCA